MEDIDEFKRKNRGNIIKYEWLIKNSYGKKENHTGRHIGGLNKKKRRFEN